MIKLSNKRIIQSLCSNNIGNLAVLSTRLHFGKGETTYNPIPENFWRCLRNPLRFKVNHLVGMIKLHTTTLFRSIHYPALHKIEENLEINQ
jgi:hypothetical protein